VLSVVIWSLTLIVTVKYVFIVLRADNEGEGGTFSTYSLLTRFVRIRSTCISLDPVLQYANPATRPTSPIAILASKFSCGWRGHLRRICARRTGRYGRR
jgi:hypothetical protein